MIQWFKDYLFRKFVADAVAVVLIVATALLSHQMLLSAFSLNNAWMDVVWSEWVAPVLPREAALAGEGVRIAHEAALKFQRAAVNAAENAKTSKNNLRDVKTIKEFIKGKWIARGETPRSSMMETWVRLLLLGEAWILKIQLSMLLRLPFTLWRLMQRRNNKLALQYQ